MCCARARVLAFGTRIRKRGGTVPFGAKNAMLRHLRGHAVLVIIDAWLPFVPVPYCIVYCLNCTATCSVAMLVL